MKDYPSIESSSKAPKDAGIAFYKYDGSNLRFEWHNKTNERLGLTPINIEKELSD